jgi:hypothetical protein
MAEVEQAPKKSSAPWKPRGSRLAVRNQEPGYRYKWASVSHSEDRVEELREEGWEIVSATTGGSKLLAGERALTSVAKIGTLRLMKMPEDMAQARDAHYEDETNRQTMRPAQRAVQMLSQLGSDYAADQVITEEIINPRTNKPFTPAEARQVVAARIRAGRYPTAAKRQHNPLIG